VQEPTGDLQAHAVGRGEGLTATQRGVTWACRGGIRDELSIAVHVDQRGADVVQPAERFERHVAGVPDEDESAQLRGHAVVATSPSISSSAILDDQVPAMNAELEPISVRNAYAVAGGLGRLSVHTNLPFVCHARGPLQRSRGRIVVTAIVTLKCAPASGTVVRIPP